jgi:hypothetical protein
MHEWQSQSHVRWECKYHVFSVLFNDDKTADIIYHDGTNRAGRVNLDRDHPETVSVFGTQLPNN